MLLENFISHIQITLNNSRFPYLKEAIIRFHLLNHANKYNLLALECPFSSSK